MANSRKVNYLWEEKKKSAVFPPNLCMVLFLSSSMPFTLLCPLQCLLSPTPNLHLTASSAPGIQSGLFPLHSLFFAAVQEEDKRKMSWTLKGPWSKAAVQKKTPTNNLKAKAAQFLHTFLVHTHTNVPVYQGSQLKMRGKSSAQSLAKAPNHKNTEVHRLLYPPPLPRRHRPDGIHLSQTTFKRAGPFCFFLSRREVWEGQR